MNIRKKLYNIISKNNILMLLYIVMWNIKTIALIYLFLKFLDLLLFISEL